MIPGYVPLVVTTRGDVVENVHHGAAAVVDRGGRVLHAVGDPHALVFTRSTLKAFQALPFVLDGGPRALGLSDEQVALTTASHSGEPFHVAAVDALLARAGQPPEALQCGCHVPYVYETLGRAPPADARFDARHHNCSGKHAGFLAACRLHGEPLADYLAPDSPLQTRIRNRLRDFCGGGPLVPGIDGCSAPNYAMPLDRLAHAFCRLALGETPALAALRFAMTRHPDLVSGDARSDLALMQAGGGDWVSKIGADGVQALGIRSKGIGIAIRIADGDRRALLAATVEVLQQLRLVDDVSATPLAPYARPAIRNLRGTMTGAVAPLFLLPRVAL